MKIVVTSDLHGHLPEIPECDLLLIAGDICPDWYHAPGLTAQKNWQLNWLGSHFHEWLATVPAKNIVGIAGNHDWAIQMRNPYDKISKLPWTYLQDETVEIDGLKIFGAPWSKFIGRWAFMLDPHELQKKWNLIPEDVDIIMVHGPAYGINDLLAYGFGPDARAGCPNLYERIVQNKYPNLKLVATGHIHEAYGQVDLHGIKWINATHMTLEYKPENAPIEFELIRGQSE